MYSISSLGKCQRKCTDVRDDARNVDNDAATPNGGDDAWVLQYARDNARVLQYVRDDDAPDATDAPYATDVGDDALNATNAGDDAPNATGEDDALAATWIHCRCGREQAGCPPTT